MTSLQLTLPPQTPPRAGPATAPAAGLLAAGALLVLVSMIGCTPPASRGGFESDNPASQLYAIHRAGSQLDRSALPHLVEALDSDDPAVRMMAIAALERITGTRLGYDPYAGPAQRDAAAQQWTEALRNGQFDQPP